MKRMTWNRAFAGAFFALLLVVGIVAVFQAQPPLNGSISPFAVIEGTATILSANGKVTPAADLTRNLLQATTLKFDSSAGPVGIKYLNGGRVALAGAGRIKILKDTVHVESGAFNARFKNLAGMLKVRVPCAVLGIRGTEIRFDIQPAKSEILLVEGAVDLVPDDPTQKTIRLEIGRKVLLQDNAWALPSPVRPHAPTSEARDGIRGENIVPHSMNQPAVATEDPAATPVKEKVEASQIETNATDSESNNAGSMTETGSETAPQGSDGFGSP